MPRTIHVAHSPDSDDAFMFYALAADKLDTGDLRYVHELSDIETLNQRARRGELEVTAVSIHAYAYLWRQYALLGSGSSMGDGYGPRLVSTRARPADPRAALRGLRVAVPGSSPPPTSRSSCTSPRWSTWWCPSTGSRMPSIAARWMSGCSSTRASSPTATPGSTSGPTWAPGGWRIPVCPCRSAATPCVAIWARPSSGQIARDLRASIVYALEHRAPALAHASRYNRGIGDERTDTFVGMYVNQWTVDYGPRGRQAVQTLLDRGHDAGIIPERVQVDFVDSHG